MGEPELRAARVEEAATLTELALRSKRTWGYDDDFMTAINDEMTVHPEYILTEHAVVAVVGGTIVGYAITYIDREGAYLRDLFVEPSAMGRGYGRALLLEAMSFARANSAQRLRLISDVNAVPFYERNGFRAVGEHSSAHVPGRALPIMSIELITPRAR